MELGYLYMGSGPYKIDAFGNIYWDKRPFPYVTDTGKTGVLTTVKPNLLPYAKYPFELDTVVDQHDKTQHNTTFALPHIHRDEPNTKGYADVVVGQELNYSLPVGQFVQVCHTIELEIANGSYGGQASWTTDIYSPTKKIWDQILEELSPVWETQGLQWWNAIIDPILILDYTSVIRITVRYIGIALQSQLTVAVRLSPIVGAAILLPRAVRPEGEALTSARLRQFVTAVILGNTGRWILDYIGPMDNPPPMRGPYQRQDPRLGVHVPTKKVFAPRANEIPWG